MPDYVPTTEDVRRAYQEHCRDYDAIDGLATSPESYEEEFDQWRALDRAEAQVEALREAAAETERKRSEPGLVCLDVRYQGYYTGIRSGMESAMRLLRATADRIAREAGIETGENND